MTTAPDPLKLVARLLTDATDARLDDTAFRQRAQRTVRRLQQALSPPPRIQGNGITTRAGAAPPARYRFVAVPNGAGGITSVSLATAVFDELAGALGGAEAVTALARRVARGHKPDSGVSRSAYVLRRLRQAAERSGRQPAGRLR